MNTVTDWFVTMLRSHPEMAVLLTLAIGYLIGKIKIGSIALGAVVGVLIAGAVIGQLGVKPSSDLKTLFFLLFLFSIGYRTGPQFFSGLRSSGFPQIALTVIFCCTALALGFGAAKVFGYDIGTAAGLMAGATTESATVGTATDAIGRLALDQAAKQALLSNLAVAFAVTYFLGVLCTVAFVSRVGPKILGVDLAAECARLEHEMGLVDDGAIASGYRPFVLRAYRVESDALHGQTVGAIENRFATRGHRLFIARVRHGDAVELATPDTIIHRGDSIAMGGRLSMTLAETDTLGPEIDDKPLLDIPVDTVEVMVADKRIVGTTLADLVQRLGTTALRGVGLLKIVRASAELPLTLSTKLARGDIVTLVGTPETVTTAAAHLGYIDRPTQVTAMMWVAGAIFIGGMIGIPAFRIGALEIGLSQSVGVLLGGLVLGWLRSIDRRIPRVPEAAVWLFDSLGLTVFLAVTALAAGPDFIHGLQRSGVTLVIAGIVIVVVPQLVTMLVGKHVFRMHPGILLGVCSGAGTSAPTLAAVQEVARSKVPTLGYGVTYAVGNVLLALWGSVIVLLMAGG